MTEPLVGTSYRQLEPQPAISTADAERVLAEAFGLRGTLTPLHADRDRNYAVVADDGGRYVLKFQNPADTAEVVAMQTAALKHVRAVDPGLPVAATVPTVTGNDWEVCVDGGGRPTYARLYPHLEGAHPETHDLDGRALHAWGATAARLGRALRGFVHPAAGYRTVWDLRHFPDLAVHLDSLDPARRPLVAELLARHRRVVEPAVPGLRAQVIHNDLSRENVLVDDRGSITGILDFGDMTHTTLVNDLAVAVADVVAGRTDALDAVLAMVAGYHSVVPLEPDEVAILPDLVAARCATVALLTIDDGGEEPAAEHWALLTTLRELGYDATADLVRAHLAAGDRPAEPADPAGRAGPAGGGRLLEARRRALGPLELSYSAPLELVSGRGVYLTSADGTTYLDAYNNVPVVGHAHPLVCEAVVRQLRRINTNTRYLHRLTVELAERLLATCPPQFDRVLLVNSGSEANDLALRIARWASGNDGVIATSFAYHGITTATAAISPEGWPDDGCAGPEVRLVEPPGARVAGLGHRALPDVEAAVRELDDTWHGVAALCVDPSFTSDGLLGPARDWVRDAAETVRAHGGVFIGDEVQAGFGRTGEVMWSSTAGGAVPDILTLGKPMGNGYPVAAVLTSSALADDFMVATDYFSTFGGGTAACAAALAVLDVVEGEQLEDNADQVGARLRAALSQVAGDSDRLGSVRGWGLLAGVEVLDDRGEPDEQLAARILDLAAEHGVLIGRTGPTGNVLKIRPPLVVEPHHADVIADAVHRAVSAATR